MGLKGSFEDYKCRFFANAIYGFLYFTIYHNLKEILRGKAD